MKKPGKIIIKGETLEEILEKHEKWLNNKEGGERANLSEADLRLANLSYADLRRANLSYANLNDADLGYANLNDADLRGANLRYADLEGADLRGANLDFSSLPLSCCGLDFKIDERLAKQIAYHLINLMKASELNTEKIFKKAVYEWLKSSHLVEKHSMPTLGFSPKVNPKLS